MKGVILAGGLGSRLLPLTKVTNKHLLPVYDKPMIYYPIECLRNAGIEEILIITGGNCAGHFLELLDSGSDLGLNDLHYTYQRGGNAGIADALKLAEKFADGQKTAVILGDNIIEGNICKAVEDFKKQPTGAKLLLKEVPDPQRFGVPELSDGKIVGIEEKPTHPKSSYAVIGIYFYDGQVFDFARDLKPSARGELEITDVNNAYIDQSVVTYDVLQGWWTDAGTTESLYRATKLVAEGGANKMTL